MIEKKTKPYEYQTTTIEHTVSLLNEYGYAALAPVEMGLGKTLMSLYAAIYKHYDLIIIVSPKTLQSNWKSEIETHTTFKNIFVWCSNKIKTQKYKTEFKNWISKPFKIFFVNIEAFQIENKKLEKIFEFLKSRFETAFVILDESTKIKSPDASRTKNLLKMSGDKWHRIILTGTPITNSPLDFFTQYEFLNRNFWGIAGSLKQAFYKFRYRYAVMIDERVSRDKVVKKVVGFKKLDELKKRIEYCTIQLKKEDCLDLPERIEQEIKLDMSDEQRKFYDTFVKKLIAEIDDAQLSVTKAIVKFTRLREICGGFFPDDETGKMIRIQGNEKLKFLLDDIEDTDEKIIIVANHHEEINTIYETLIEEYDKDSTVVYTGLQSIQARENNLQAFKTNERTRFMILNPATGAFGLNLQFCRIMYFYSLPLSPEQFWQLKDRIHRVGQKNNCLYKYLLYRQSIDERLKTILDKKQEFVKLFTSKESIKNFLLEDVK